MRNDNTGLTKRHTFQLSSVADVSRTTVYVYAMIQTVRPTVSNGVAISFSVIFQTKNLFLIVAPTSVDVFLFFFTKLYNFGGVMEGYSNGGSPIRHCVKPLQS